MSGDRNRPPRRKRLRSPEKASSLLRGLLADLGLTNSVIRHEMVQAWPKLMDAAIAAHTSAEKVTGSVLHIDVDSSVWMTELTAMQPEILEKVNAYLPRGAAPITEIRLKQRSWARPKAPAQPKPEPVLPKPQLDDKALAHLETIQDPELRALLQRLMEKQQTLDTRRSLEEKK